MARKNYLMLSSYLAVFLLDGGALLYLVAIVLGWLKVPVPGHALAIESFTVPPFLLSLGLIFHRLARGTGPRSLSVALVSRLTTSLEKTHSRMEVVWVVLPIGICLVIMGIANTLPHLSFRLHSYDLEVFDQVLWNTAHGRWFAFSIHPRENFLAYHFSPILLLLVPFYWLVPSPLVPIWAQAIFITLGGIPIYWLARKALNQHTPAFLFLLLYLSYPPLQMVSATDFHPIILGIPLLSAAFCSLHAHRMGWFAFFLALALTTQEEVTLVVFIFGVYLCLLHGRWRAGLICATTGLALFFLEMGLVIPHFAGGSAYEYLHRYLGEGQPHNLRGFLSALFLAPLSMAWTAAQHLPYTAPLFAPAGFFSLLSPPHLLLALPNLAANLLSHYHDMYTFRFQYPSSAIPFIFIAAIFGFKNLCTRFPLPHLQEPLNRVFGIFLLLLVLWNVQTLPLRGITGHWEPERRKAGNTLVHHVPSTASVVSSPSLLRHLTQRERIYAEASPNGLRPDYLAVAEDDSRWPRQPTLDLLGPSREYENVYSAEGFHLFRFNPSKAPTISFSGWREIEGQDQAASAPAAVLLKGQPFIVIRRPDNRLYWTVLGSGIWAPVPSGLTSSQPAAAVVRDTVYLFVVGLDGMPYMNRFRDGHWQERERVPGGLVAGLDACFFQGELFLFARGADEQIYANRLRVDRWVGWEAVPEKISAVSAPRVEAINDQYLCLITRAEMRHAKVSLLGPNGWSGFRERPAEDSNPSVPSAVALEDRLLVFMQGIDNHVYMREYFGLLPWLGTLWTEVPGGKLTPSPPTVLRLGADRALLLIHGPDNRVYMNEVRLTYAPFPS